MPHSDHPKEPDPRWVALGDALKRLRGDLSIAKLAALQRSTPGYLSETTLRRFEAGASIKLAYAHHVDELYRGAGAIEAEIRLLRSREAPLERAILDVPSDAIAKARVYWPKDYTGDVWLRLHGSNDDVQRIWLSWGGWRCVVDVRLSRQPVLVTGQTATHDEDRAPLLVEAVVDFTADSGVGGGPAGASIVRLHRRWHPVEA